ncbi:MAG: hypothetical protein AAF696_31395 [Bacteroidota bacterium]
MRGFDLGFAKKDENDALILRCKICQSTYRLESDEFGFAVQWMVLRLEEKKSKDIGAVT